MTEKRFEFAKNVSLRYNCIIDNTIDVKVESHKVLKTNEVLDMLNSLNDENEQLKKQLKQKEDLIDEVWQKYEYAHGMSIDNTDWF